MSDEPIQPTPPRPEEKPAEPSAIAPPVIFPSAEAPPIILQGKPASPANFNQWLVYTIRVLFAISMLAIGWLIGCPIVGRISDTLNTRKAPLIIGAVGGFITMGLFLFAGSLNMTSMMLLMFIMGLCTSTQSIAFAFAIEISPRELAATAVGVCNFITMMAAAGLQNAIGWILNSLIDTTPEADHPAATHGDAGVTDGDFMIAMAIIPVLFLVSIGLCMLLRRTGRNTGD